MAVSKKTTVNEAAQDETEQAPQTVAPKRRRAPAKRAEKEVATLETAGLKLSVEAPEEAEAPKTKPVRRRTRKTAEAAEAAVTPNPGSVVFAPLHLHPVLGLVHFFVFPILLSLLLKEEYVALIFHFFLI